MSGRQPTLSVKNLSLTFGHGSQQLQALDNVSLELAEGEVLALVGESGCGKSITMMSILGLLPATGAKLSADDIRLGDTDLNRASQRTLRNIRGKRIGMIFQDPMTSLTPVQTVGFQIVEVLRRHLKMSRKAAYKRSIELLDLVRIPDAVRRVGAYPHELSGGMRQRVMIAMALACSPELLIADEPTTALDVTVQAQIMELIAELRRDLGMSVVLITHDLGVVASAADRVAVMYAGRIVEQASVEQLFRHPSHGYTAGLIRSLPLAGEERQRRLVEIPGSVPRLSSPSIGCAFADRCDFATPACRQGPLAPVEISEGHSVNCINHAMVVKAMHSHELVRAWA